MLERDGQTVPVSVDEAWERWQRPGVAQFRQPHYLQPRARIVLEEELPDVLAALEAAGAARFDALSMMPPLITDRSPRDGDERFKTITARRPVLEQVLARTASEEPGLELHHGVAVRELLVTDYDGTPHVLGVRTESGDELRADLVVDATGRRSQLVRWLEAASTVRVPDEVEDLGFVYYTRFFRRGNGPLPEFRAPLLTAVGTFSILVIPGDSDTWSVTLFISGDDRPLKRLRAREAWTALVAACPLHAQWLEGEPITDVVPMGGIVDRYRRFTLGNQPIVTGVAAVADAWACTNPSLGRGISLGLVHVQCLRDAVREHLGDPLQFAQAWDAVTEAELAPWYRETVEENRDRFAEIQALRNGIDRMRNPRPSPLRQRALFAAVGRDPDVFRAYLASRCCLTRLHESLADQDFAERISELARDSDPPPPMGPNRAQLLSLLEVPLAAAA